MQWIHYDYCEVVCAIDWGSKHADKFVIVAFITCFIAPAVTMLVCYSVIFRVRLLPTYTTHSLSIIYEINKMNKYKFIYLIVVTITSFFIQ